MSAIDMDEAVTREYVSQYASYTAGLVIHSDGEPTDADGNVVTVRMDDAEGDAVFERPADREGQGVYATTLTSMATQTPGIYRLTWTYSLDGEQEIFISYIEVGKAAPAYDALPEGMKGVIEQVLHRFSDLFDSHLGGPHLQVYFQTNFTRQRLAQLLRTALSRLNTASQPTTTYAIEGPPAGALFPLDRWGGLLEDGLYLEVLKHLIRSYVEQPQAVGVNVARQDRRDYMSRWQMVLGLDQDAYTSQLDIFKMAHLGLGRPRVLVSGGVYGSYGPLRFSHSAAARPRYQMRFH